MPWQFSPESHRCLVVTSHKHIVTNTGRCWVCVWDFHCLFVGECGFTNEENRDATGLDVRTLINGYIPSTMWPGTSAGGLSSAGRAGCQIALRSDTGERRGTACYVSGQTGSPLTSPSV